MGIISLLVVFCAAFLGNCWQATDIIGYSAESKSCGIADIDRIRAEVRLKPTDASNIQSRRAALFRWWRSLWHQGFEMNTKDYDFTWERVIRSRGKPSFVAIDAGFKALEDIMENGKTISEVPGKENSANSKTTTNWPFYHGTDGRQTGFTPDAGPSQGKIVWKAPKGNFWYATPIIKHGRIYTASPGADVIAYCLDEQTGEVIWNGRQFGHQVYQTPGSVFTPVVTSKRVLVSTGWWQPSNLFSLDLSTGKTQSQIPAGNTTGAISKDLAVYKHNRWNVILADANSGKGVWQFSCGGNLSGEPILSNTAIYAARQSGQVFRWNVDSSQPVWQSKLDANLRGTPAIGQTQLYAGDNQRRLHAVDLSTGHANWTFQPDLTEAEPRAYQYFSTAIESTSESTAENKSRVYVGSASGFLYCLDSEDGSLIWKYKLSDWVRSKPLIVGDTIYVATLDAKLVAVKDKGDSARELWSKKLGEHGFTADLAGNKNGILASGMDLILYSVSPKTGELQWRHSLIDATWVKGVRHRADVFAGQYQASPVVVDDVLYVGGPNGFLTAHDVHTGKQLWRFEARGRISATPCVAEGKIFVGQNGRYNEYYAIDQKSGKPIWQRELGWAGVGGSTYNNGRVFVGTNSGKFYGLDAKEGDVLWKHEGKIARKGFHTPPAIDDEFVYTGCHDGRYYALNQVNGTVAWSVDTSAKAGVSSGGNPDSAGIVLSNSRIYIQKKGASIAALDRDTGKEIWQWRQPENYLQNGTVVKHRDMVFGSVVRDVTSLPYLARIYAIREEENSIAQQWSYSDAGGGGGLTAPVLAKGKLIFGSSSGVFVTCLNPENGQLKWRCYVGGPMEEGVPALYGNKVFTHHRNGYLFAIE